MEHQLKISKTARYFTYGNPETATHIWIVLHGYSQLPYYFIRKFHALDPERNFVVAPEGFHRFYREGTKGRVGASWMTKEARLDDIADNMAYLDLLAETVLKGRHFEQRILLGFSQGGATASRWHHYGRFHAHHFILWACVFADDIALDDDAVGMYQSNNYFVIGDDDIYFKGKIDAVKTQLLNAPFPIHIKEFKGPHDIDKPTLLEIASEIAWK